MKILFIILFMIYPLVVFGVEGTYPKLITYPSAPASCLDAIHKEDIKKNYSLEGLNYLIKEGRPTFRFRIKTSLKKIVFIDCSFEQFCATYKTYGPHNDSLPDTFSMGKGSKKRSCKVYINYANRNHASKNQLPFRDRIKRKVLTFIGDNKNIDLIFGLKKGEKPWYLPPERKAITR